MKIALVYAFQKSQWRSCQTITENLLSVYQQCVRSEDLLSINYHSNITDYELLNETQNLLAFKPDKIIIADHTPHPYRFLAAVDKVFSDKRPELIIHVFGDFTLFVKEWIRSEKILKKFKVKFICASERQGDLISSFLSSAQEAVFISPFPVDQEKFYYSKKLREDMRAANHIDQSSLVYVYTGRLSKQKNIIEMMQAFSQFLILQNSNARMLLAGAFDDIGSPFVGYMAKESYEQTCLKFLETLQDSPETKDKILYIGNLNSDKLLELYNMADVFVSLSAHNDEDFGMSPAEAICTGLPAILSNWAGYASFKNINQNNYCHLIKVDMKEGFIDFSRAEFLHSLIETQENIDDIREKREDLAVLNLGNFSKEACQKIIKTILKKDAAIFKGFSELFYEMEIAFQKAYAPFGTILYQFNYTDLYKRVYQSYVSKKS